MGSFAVCLSVFVSMCPSVCKDKCHQHECVLCATPRLSEFEWVQILCVWAVSASLCPVRSYSLCVKCVEGRTVCVGVNLQNGEGTFDCLNGKKEHVQLLQIYHWAPVFILSHGERLRQPEGLSLYPLILFHTFYFTIYCFGLWELSCQLVCSSVKYAISNNSA